MEKDRDDYRTLLGLYSEGLDLLRQLYAAESQHAYVKVQKPDIKYEYEELEGFLEEMNKLEERIPDFARSGLAFRRKELEARRQSIEREAEEQRKAAGPPKPSADQLDKDRKNL